MAGIPETLREIHRLRRLARDFQTEIDRAPFQMKAQKAKAAKLDDAFKTAQETLKQLKVTIRDREASLKATHQQIDKYKRQYDEAKDQKQFDALKHEIEGAQAKASAFEEEILTALGDSEEKAAQLPEAEKAAKRGHEEFAAFEKEQQTRLARFSEQLRQTLAQLKEVEANLPDEVKHPYARLVASYGADALAAVKDRVCQQCHTEVTVQQQHETEHGKFVCCTSCGRGLYVLA